MNKGEDFKDKIKPKIKMNSGLPVINAHAGAVDIGDTEHHVAISDGKGNQLVWTFDCFTEDLHAIVELMKEHGITTVAMEATGVYYVSLYLLLEESGIDVYLVNASHTKNVTGRKDDDNDAMWAQKLHACGLLQKSFQPEAEDRAFREYVRHRKNLITQNSDSVRRMQKALELMNIKIHTVIRDIMGKTGMDMLAAILGGERDAQVLAQLRDPRIRASEEDIIKSLTGIWAPQYLFTLKQAYDEYHFRLKQIKECEELIQKQLIKKAAIVKTADITDVALETKKKEEGRINSAHL